MSCSLEVWVRSLKAETAFESAKESWSLITGMYVQKPWAEQLEFDLGLSLEFILV